MTSAVESGHNETAFTRSCISYLMFFGFKQQRFHSLLHWPTMTHAPGRTTAHEKAQRLLISGESPPKLFLQARFPSGVTKKPTREKLLYLSSSAKPSEKKRKTE